jgi:hypothetical protein
MQVPVDKNDMLTLPPTLVNSFLQLHGAFNCFFLQAFSTMLPAGAASDAITGCFAA